MSVRLFVLHRHVDASGVSGTGIVADGVDFGPYVVLCWRTTAAGVPGLGIYRSIEEVETIHGHGGLTRVVWEGEPYVQHPTEHLLREEP